MRMACIAAMVAAGFCSAAMADDEITIEGANIERDVDCTSGNVGIYGSTNGITLTGQCKNITVYGANHTVSFDKAEKLVVSGSANKVSGGTTQHLLVEVANNVIESTMNAGDNVSTVNISGAENQIALKLEGQVTINVAGAKHKVTWSGASGAKPPKVNIVGIQNSVKKAK